MRLHLVGVGELNEARRRRLEGRPAEVRALGSVPHAELPRLLNAAMVFVLPSHYEGHPKALIEAMACGRPVVASRRPGLMEAVDDGVTGLLCEPDAASIRDTIRRLLDDAPLRRRLGDAAREAASALGLDAVAEQELGVIREVLDHG